MAGADEPDLTLGERRLFERCPAHGVPIKVVEYQLELAQDVDEGNDQAASLRATKHLDLSDVAGSGASQPGSLHRLLPGWLHPMPSTDLAVV